MASTGEFERRSQRRRLASKAFQHVAGYDTLISAYLRQPDTSGDDKTGLFPDELTFGWNRVAIPRYGENPHQAGGIYVTPGETGGIVNAKQVHGIAMSYLNYFDADAAWVSANSYQSLGQHCVAVVKHANPCGLATDDSQAEAYRKAYAGDPISAFGGIVGFNATVTAETATAMKGVLYDVIRGPLSQLSFGGLQSSSCAIDDVQQEAVVLSEASQPGEGSWFLLRGANVCDAGTYNSGGPGQNAPRPVGACP